MTSSSTTAAARKRFDQAMSLFDNDQSAAQARLPRETNRLGVRLSASIKAGPYLAISVTESSHAGLALASALVDDGQYEKAESLLKDSTLLDTWENHQWQQYVRAYLMFATQRWPDVISVAATILPPQAIIMSAVTAATNALAAHAAAHLGQGRVALDWADRVDLRAGHVGVAEARRHQLTDTAVSAIDPNEFPLIAADLAYVRGMAHRELDKEDRAQVWLSRATINGALIEPAKDALADPNLQLVVTDEETINTRSNKWDVSTERSEKDRREEQNEERREELLAEGRTMLNNQVGLSEVKRAVAEIEDQIEVRALRMAAGRPVTNQTNHMLLVGPPGTGKTTTAEALGKIYAGLGIVRHPEIIEVKRADFCGEHIGASGPRTNELIARSLGRILFMDEFYSLVERHHDGRPDMIGMEAVNQLLVALEVHRFDFCFIGAGYEKEVDEFLTVNPGLAGRFNRKLRFESYAPDELVEIAVRYGAPRATVIEPAAREALNIACKTLRAYLAPNGSHGIDVMQNGRFARNVVERAERLRDSRVAAQHRTDKGSVTVEDLETLRTQDIVAAVVDACAEKHVPIQL